MRTGDSAGAAVPGCTAGKCLRTDSRPITFVSLFMSSRVCAPLAREEADGDIVNCESVPGKTSSLSVFSYSSHSMMAIHYVPLRLPMVALRTMCPGLPSVNRQSRLKRTSAASS